MPEAAKQKKLRLWVKRNGPIPRKTARFLLSRECVCLPKDVANHAQLLLIWVFFCVNIVNGADGLPRCYIRDLDHLKERLRLCWAQLSQHQVTKAIAAVPKRLEACLASGGARFEHRLL